MLDAKPLMEKTLVESPLHVYSVADLKSLVSENRTLWRLPQAMPAARVIAFMESQQLVRKLDLPFPSRPLARYVWGEPRVYEVALSVKADGFLSHYTAMHLHGLTEQIPKTIYVNDEQPPQRGVLPDLTQEAIHAAFRRPARTSGNIAEFDGWRICQLSTMGTMRLGVVAAAGPYGESIAVTDLERTLVDIAVRPVYAGGVQEVLKAFRRAGGRLSVNRLASVLKQMDYRYPYHQSIGFYLERAGCYSAPSIELFRRLPRDFDFHLAHNMTQTEYVSDWRLFVPKGF